MGNLLESGARWLAQQLQTHVATRIVYMRGNERVALQATIGKTELQTEEANGFITRLTSRDFIFPAAALILGGSPTLPRDSGDRILEPHDGKTFVYEVAAPAPNEQPFRYADEFHVLLRVHTKHVSTEDL